MSFQILPNLIFLFAILGIIVLILRRVPEATGASPLPGLHKSNEPEEAKPEDGLREKGVPAAALSNARKVATITGKKVWRFILEAKGLTQSPAVNYRIKKFLGRGPREMKKTNPMMDETYFIDQIKRFPKDWQKYNDLGQFYMDKKDYGEALGVYDYLTKQDPVSVDFWARHGYAKMCLQDFDGAAESYEKSVELDQSFPNRYYNLALAYIETGKPDKAAAALKKAIELEPENNKYTEALAEVNKTQAKK